MCVRVFLRNAHRLVGLTARVHRKAAEAVRVAEELVEKNRKRLLVNALLCISYDCCVSGSLFRLLGSVNKTEA